eukprot:3702995-Prymnesium_polylepis.1
MLHVGLPATRGARTTHLSISAHRNGPPRRLEIRGGAYGAFIFCMLALLPRTEHARRISAHPLTAAGHLAGS